jgi:DNA-binding NarL/FixJ family response regulator
MSESAQTLPIPITEALFDEGMRIAQRKLGDVAFGAAWAEGRAMSMDSVLADAQAVEVLPHSDSPARLTPAEVEVLRRLSRGHTTRQIAAELVVAVSTIDRHITHIYGKIGRRGRSAATAFALENGLT